MISRTDMSHSRLAATRRRKDQGGNNPNRRRAVSRGTGGCIVGTLCVRSNWISRSSESPKNSETPVRSAETPRRQKATAPIAASNQEEGSGVRTEST